MKPKVSIILPIYGVERFLDRCIKTIINQTLKEIEIILVDDGSLDKCPKMCDNYALLDSRIKVIHKHNEGLGLARNTGFEHATGEYVAFIDSDDYVDNNMIKILYEYAKRHNLNAAYCGTKIVNKDGCIIEDRLEVETYTELNKTECKQHVLDLIASRERKKISSKYMMSVWHSIFNRNFLKEHDINFCSERNFISEDMIFDIDFFSVASKVGFIPYSLYYYCFNQDSLSRQFNINLYGRYKKQYYEVINKLLKYKFTDEEVCIAHKYMLVKTRYYIKHLYLLNKNNKDILEKGLNKVFSDKEMWNKIYRSTVRNYLSVSYRIYLYILKSRNKFLLKTLEDCSFFISKLKK